MTVERRKFLIGAAVGMGSVVYSKGLAAMLAESEAASHADHALMMDWEAWTNQPVDAFSLVKRKLVSALTETLLPKTDTPGAIDAGVPKFLELLYMHWMEPAEKKLFDQGLAEADNRALKEHGSEFATSDAGIQKSVLEAMEEEQGGHPWFEFGGEILGNSRAELPFMALFKETTVTGFFMSEVGAKQVLRYDPMPGLFDGKLDLSPDDSTWASVPLM